MTLKVETGVERLQGKAMNLIEELEERLRARVPGIKAELDPPVDLTGSWFLDARLNKNAVDVEWRPALGFVVSSRRVGTYVSDAPAELFPQLDDAVDRITEILARTAEKWPRSMTPGDLLRARWSTHVWSNVDPNAGNDRILINANTMLLLVARCPVLWSTTHKSRSRFFNDEKLLVLTNRGYLGWVVINSVYRVVEFIE
jgi:hypothetical protein